MFASSRFGCVADWETEKNVVVCFTGLVFSLGILKFVLFFTFPLVLPNDIMIRMRLCRATVSQQGRRHYRTSIYQDYFASRPGSFRGGRGLAEMG